MIKDRDVRNALDVVATEIEAYEGAVEDLSNQVQELEAKLDERDTEIEHLNSQISELEEALAEAYLTSEKDDSGVSREDVEIQTGCGPDVSHSADN